MSLKIGLFSFLTFGCIITPIFGIIDHCCIIEIFKKSGKNKNKLRALCFKNHEKIKNSKHRVQFYWFLQKKVCYTLENKEYSEKLFWGTEDVIVNTADIWGTVRPLLVSRNKAVLGSVDEVAETFQI